MKEEPPRALMTILTLIYVLSESFLASFFAVMFATSNPSFQETAFGISLWGAFFSSVLIISQMSMLNQGFFLKLHTLAWRTFEVSILAAIASLFHGSLEFTLYYIILFYFFSYSGRMLGYVYSMLSSPFRSKMPFNPLRIGRYIFTIIVPTFVFFLIPALVPFYYGIPYTDFSGNTLSFIIGILILGHKAIQYGTEMDPGGEYFKNVSN